MRRSDHKDGGAKMVELEIDGHVAHIKLNRPEKLNAMN